MWGQQSGFWASRVPVPLLPASPGALPPEGATSSTVSACQNLRASELLQLIHVLLGA